MLKIIVCCSVIGLSACQPKTDSDSELKKDKTSLQQSTAEAAQQFIVAKTVPVNNVKKQSCDESGCTQYDLQTVETNHHWINEYFQQRIQKIYPVAFNPSEQSASTASTKEDKALNQEYVIVRYVGQNQHLATFSLLTYSYSAGAAHGMYHNEFVNFDLKQKKRIALEDLVVAGAKDKLRDAIYDANTNWLIDHTIDQDKLNVSDNFYYGANGIVFVYPLYELASYAEGMSELTLPYQSTQKLIRAEYLPNLPMYKTE